MNLEDVDAHKEIVLGNNWNKDQNYFFFSERIFFKGIFLKKDLKKRKRKRKNTLHNNHHLSYNIDNYNEKS